MSFPWETLELDVGAKRERESDREQETERTY